LVTGSLEGGGAERQLADMANYWAGRGYRVTLVTWSGPEVPDFYRIDDGVDRVHLAVAVNSRAFVGKLISSLRRIAKLRKLIGTQQPDIVLSFLTQSNVLAILAAAGTASRVVVSERVHPALDTSLSLIWRFLRRVLYPSSAAVVVQTAHAANWIGRRWQKRVVVIPNALCSVHQTSEARQTLVVAVGRLSAQKGFDLLLRAFAGVARDFPSWTVAVVGQGQGLNELMRLRDDLGLATRVSFVGEVRDVTAWMARAGIVVQPSRFEGFPNVVLESMGAGAAVISADCLAGPSDLIDDGVNGRLVPTENVAALADAMAQLMAEPATRERLGNEAKKVRQRYRQDLIMAQWEALLLPDAAKCNDVMDSSERLQ
jgi:glycosyltransferase involved in cell wall biosynthesis